jgi:hypothetical protein
MIGGVATAAAMRTWPFRVFSFPSEVVRPRLATVTQKFYSDLSGRLIFDPPSWDWNMIAQHEAFQSQTLFTFSPDTGRGSRVTEA